MCFGKTTGRGVMRRRQVRVKVRVLVWAGVARRAACRSPMERVIAMEMNPVMGCHSGGGGLHMQYMDAPQAGPRHGRAHRSPQTAAARLSLPLPGRAVSQCSCAALGMTKRALHGPSLPCWLAQRARRRAAAAGGSRRILVSGLERNLIVGEAHSARACAAPLASAAAGAECGMPSRSGRGPACAPSAAGTASLPCSASAPTLTHQAASIDRDPSSDPIMAPVDVRGPGFSGLSSPDGGARARRMLIPTARMLPTAALARVDDRLEERPDAREELGCNASPGRGMLSAAASTAGLVLVGSSAMSVILRATCPLSVVRRRPADLPPVACPASERFKMPASLCAECWLPGSRSLPSIDGSSGTGFACQDLSSSAAPCKGLVQIFCSGQSDAASDNKASQTNPAHSLGQADRARLVVQNPQILIARPWHPPSPLPAGVATPSLTPLRNCSRHAAGAPRRAVHAPVDVRQRSRRALSVSKQTVCFARRASRRRTRAGRAERGEEAVAWQRSGCGRIRGWIRGWIRYSQERILLLRRRWRRRRRGRRSNGIAGPAQPLSADLALTHSARGRGRSGRRGKPGAGGDERPQAPASGGVY